MIEYRPGEDRFVTRAEGRTTWHSFSFGAHYDPGNVGFARARGPQRRAASRPGRGTPTIPMPTSRSSPGCSSGALRHTSTVGSGVDRAGRGAATLGRQRGGALRGRRRAGTDPLPAGLGAARRARSRARLPRDDRSRSATAGPAWRAATARAAYPSPRRVRRSTWPTSPPGDRLDLPDAGRLHVFVARGTVMLGERLLEDRRCGPARSTRAGGPSPRRPTATSSSGASCNAGY